MPPLMCDVRGQLGRVGFFLSSLDSGDHTHVIRLGRRVPLPSQPSHPRHFLFYTSLF